MNKALNQNNTRPDSTDRLLAPLTELMRSHRRRIEGVASGNLTLDERGVREMATVARTMEEMIEQQDRQSVPQLTAIDWLGRAELQISETRRRVARGELDPRSASRAIDAAMSQLVAARVAGNEGRMR